MNTINVKQNDPNLIELLKAQRVAYSQCKYCQVLDVISLVIAVIAPIIGIIYSDLVNVLAAAGVVWTAIYLAAEKYRRAKTEQGAKLQEQFDTELFGLPWNNILCKNRVPLDVRRDLAIRYDSNDLHDWYSKEIGSQLPIEIAILLCQRINFSWELKLRNRFVLFLVIIALLYYGVFIAISTIQNIGFYNILLLVAPSLPLLMFCIQNVFSLQSHINSKKETLEIIDQKINAYQVSRSLPTFEELRQIQDVIFVERTVPEKVPDWFYNFYKESNENRTDEIIRAIKSNF